MAQRAHVEIAAAESPEAVLCRRAWKFRRRGNERRAMIALRDAAYREEHDARLWMLYGVQCARAGAVDAARKAISHAAWLRERRHEPRKAEVIRSVLTRLVAEAA